MKRELKFRLWSDSLKVMYSPENQIGNLWSIPEADNGILKVRDDEVLMQFTGLKDKNGKEIYEGDIIKYDKWIGKVKWGNERASFCSVDKDNFGGELAFQIYARDGELPEIIGNIYKNPELIES